MSTASLNAGLHRPRAVVRRPARPVSLRAGSAARLARPERHRPTVRLTRRGRVVAIVALLALMFAVLTVFGSHSAATGEKGTPVLTRTVEVAPGDTLWGIASDVAAPGEVRDLVHQIQELNAMDGPGVRVGQEIAVPVG